ncbi:MAG: DNA repair protein RecO [Burkholderiales bacterium]|nr:DNA repair protein RecO [Burkholderiales bacterium]
MSAGRVRAASQPAFVLHARRYRETSLIVEAFTPGFGRVALVARGARRPGSSLRGLLLSFQPLLLGFSGSSELKTLTAAEWDGAYAPLRGEALVCGFYLNELVLKLLARDDPHEALYAAYRESVAGLAAGSEREALLRRFELTLLAELGYGVALERDAASGAPIAAEARYIYVVERGAVPAEAAGREIGVELAGRTLIDMRRGEFAGAATREQCKTLMRALINHCLGNQVLHTRQLLRELQEL